jgi:hypothetical protein
MGHTLAIVLRVASVPVGVGIGFWTALLRATAPLSSCPLMDSCHGRSSFPMWQCALFGAGAAVVVLLLSVAASRRPSARSLRPQTD